MSYKQQQMRPVDIWGVAAVDPNREVGLEIECEGRKLIDGGILSYWNMHRDPSLRGEENMEYTLKQPVERRQVYDRVAYLAKKFKEHGTILKPSNRTSLHTHINVQSMTMKQIVSFVVLYMIVENLMVDHCGPERKGNLFCLRSSEAEYLVRLLEVAIHSDSYAGLGSDDIRYSSCNLAALGKFGSLEFRSHPSTVDADEIDRWVTMLLEIKDKSLTYANPPEIIREFSRLGAEGFLKEIGPVVYRTLRKVQDLEYQTEQGLNLAQGVAFATKWLPTPERKDIERKDSGGEVARPFEPPQQPDLGWNPFVPPDHVDPLPLVQPQEEAVNDRVPLRGDYPGFAQYMVAFAAWERRQELRPRRQPGPVAGPVAPARVGVAVPPKGKGKQGWMALGWEENVRQNSIWEWLGGVDGVWKLVKEPQI